MKAYLDLLRHVLDHGTPKEDRTGVGTFSLFGHQMRFDLSEGFPLMTTKKVHLKSVIHELLWFLRGETNVRYLREHGVTIWDEWADESGELGPIYGRQWRNWQTPDGKTIDQIAQVAREIRSNPDSRRLIVSAWNVADLDQMKLPPCHILFQFYVAPPPAPAAGGGLASGNRPKGPGSGGGVADGRLSCQLYQRSADVFLGVPFNIASYALLPLMMAQVCAFQPGEFIHTLGDAHLYKSHLEQAQLQISREPYPPPRMRLNPKVTSIFDFKYEDFTLENYQHHPSISAPIAV